MSTIFLDAESYSEAELKKVGSHAYAQHPSTRVLLWSVLVDDWDHPSVFREPDLWTLLDHLHDANQVDWNRTKEGKPLYIVHWGAFDRLIAQHVCGGEFVEHPDRPVLVGPKQTYWCDLRQVSLTYGGPGKLDAAAEWWGQTELKSAGGRLISLFCKPQSDGSAVDPATDPVRWGRFETYAQRDTACLRPIYERLAYYRAEGHRHSEHWPYLRVVDRMNERGVPVDTPSTKAAIMLMNDAEADLSAECQAEYGFKPTQVEKVREALGTDDCRAETLQELIASNPGPEATWLANARLAVAGAARKKLQPLLRMQSPDGRIRGCFEYHGAWTGRLTSMGVQVQNFVRSPSDDAFFDGVHLAEASPEIFEAVRSNIRGFLQAEPGRVFVAADYAQIELRVGAWLAGEQWLVDALASGVDVYKKTAADIYGKKVEFVNAEQRQFGKTVELGSLYQLGGKGLMNQMLQRGESISEPDAAEAIRVYRNSHPCIVQAWWQLGDLFQELIGEPPGTWAAYRAMRLYRGEHFIKAVRPSGRAAYYWLPQMVEGHWPDGQPRIEIGYVARDRSGKMSETRTYGGDIFQTFTQGTAADLMLEGMLEAEYAGYLPVLSIHDEIVSEVLEDRTDSEAELCEIISQLPDWAEGLPVVAEGWIGTRFTK